MNYQPKGNDGDGLYIDPQVLNSILDSRHIVILMRVRDSIRQRAQS